MARYAFVINLTRCLGCRSCMEACKVENNTPAGAFWMYVFREERGTYPNVRVNFSPRPCMHCDNPPCVKVCPVNARYKRDDGFVLTDFGRCIGCRYCMVACPYGVNYFNWKNPTDNQYFNWKGGEGETWGGAGKISDYTDGAIPPYKNPDFEKHYGEEQRLVAGGSHYVGVMGKCTWCVHRVEKGKKPACVDICPVHTLHFGDLDDPENPNFDNVLTMIKENVTTRLLEELGTKPNVYYIRSDREERNEEGEEME